MTATVFVVVRFKKLSFVSNRLLYEKRENNMITVIRKEVVFMSFFYEGSWSWLIEFLKNR